MGKQSGLSRRDEVITMLDLKGPSRARRLRSMAAVAVCVALIASSGVHAQATAEKPLVPGAVMRKLTMCAKALARKGRAAEVKEIQEVLAELGHDSAALDKLDRTCRQSLAKAGRPSPAGPALSRRIRQTAASMGRHLEKIEAAARPRLARQILRLDAEEKRAHTALGHVCLEGAWIAPSHLRILERRREIAIAVQKARSLPVPLEDGETDDRILNTLGYPPCPYVKCRDVKFFGPVGKGYLQKLMREIMRAYALSAYVRTGRFDLPGKRWRYIAFMLPSKKDYLAVVERARRAGLICDDETAHADEWGAFRCKNGLHVEQVVTFAYSFSGTLQELSMLWQYHQMKGRAQICLLAGHLNWVCLTYLGTQLPPTAWVETTVKKGKRAEYDDPGEAEERRSMLRFKGAGLAGSRSWMLYLAGRREDPVWSHSMVDAIGKVRGDDLLKCTFVVEYLQECRRFRPLLKATLCKRDAEPDPIPQMQEALGEPLAAFEARWRAWFLPAHEGLVQRLDPRPAEPLRPDERKVLSLLNRLREKAWPEDEFGAYTPVQLDEALCAGARAHARYLRKHPEQAAAWPDAHEEYPDKEGFCVEGNWAGSHSVIAPGVRSPDEAIAGWMGTFYHRLPLLEAGLLRIGWGLEHDIAVLDAGSIVNPDLQRGWIRWPYLGMKDVPLEFAPELPNPVPGADQTAFGYPITMQYIGNKTRAKMRLFAGGSPSAKGEVSCIYLTPEQPRNIELAPVNAFCLIPKEHLRPRTTYAVEATVEGKSPFVWTFKTR